MCFCVIFIPIAFLQVILCTLCKLDVVVFFGGYSCANISSSSSQYALQPDLHGNESVLGYELYAAFAIVAILYLVESIRS